MCRYFCGLSATPKQQKTLIEDFFNACFTKNKAAAREGVVQKPAFVFMIFN